MLTLMDSPTDRLARYRQIRISVIGNSGHKIPIPVWFVLEGEKLYLLPSRDRIRGATGTC
jgi:hypothetical protein